MLTETPPEALTTTELLASVPCLLTAASKLGGFAVIVKIYVKSNQLRLVIVDSGEGTWTF